MSKDLVKAKHLLQNENHTCVFVRDDIIYKSCERGVKPLLQMIDTKGTLDGFCAADKVVGKAAAFLYVLLRVKEIHAVIISQSALKVLQSYDIPVSYNTLTKAIRNRTNTGFCPMEQATLDITDPHEALETIKSTLRKING